MKLYSFKNILTDYSLKETLSIKINKSLKNKKNCNWIRMLRTTTLIRLASSPQIKINGRLFSTLEIGKQYEGTKYDYLKRGYGVLDQYRDPSVKRLGENSLIITVEGNMSSGKSEFGRALAKRINFLYAREIDIEHMLYTLPNGLNKREEINKIVGNNEKYRLSTLNDWHDNPLFKRTAELQYKLYYCRYFQYLMVLTHLFSTGQGIVIERSPHTDIVYSEALYESNLLSKEAFEWIRTQFYEQSVCNLWKPHLMIYLNKSPQKCLETFQKKQKSNAVNEELLVNIESIYTKKFLPEYEKKNHVLTYDSHDVDIEEVLLNMESIDFNDLNKMTDWKVRRIQNVNNYRSYVANYKYHQELIEKMKGYVKVPELLLHGEEYVKLEDILRETPLTDESGYNSKSSVLSQMFSLFTPDHERTRLSRFLF